MKSDLTDLALLTPSEGRSARAARLSLSFGLAVFDQGIFAGASFIVTVLLARWMTQTDFGAFSVAYYVYVLFQNVFEGLIHEPFGIFGAGRLSRQLQAYTGRLLIGLSFLGVVFTGMILVLALVLHAIGQYALANAFAGAAVAVTFLMARVAIRQPLYILSCVHWSVAAGAIYLVCILAALCALRSWSMLTAFSAFLAMGVASAISSGLIILILLKPIWRSSDAALAPRELIADHIAYGKWAIGERFLLWFQTSIFFLELPIVAGLHGTGAYRAISILVLPALMTLGAVGAVMLPMLVRVQAEQPKPYWVRLLLPGAILGMFGYGVALVVFGDEIGHLLFGGQYDADLTTPLLTVVAIGLIPAAITGVLELQLRAAVRIRQILIARVAATAALMLVGIILTAWFQLLGALIALDVVLLTTACVHLGMNRRRRLTGTGSDPGPGR
jgi:O-antigen/teichoic acid export membrane protein